jgi:hypothetical protein
LLCKAFFFAREKAPDTPPTCRSRLAGDAFDPALPHHPHRWNISQGFSPMELLLETVALFALKLAYETEDSSPILRDDLVMSDYEREVFGLLVRRGDVEAIQYKVDECMVLALNAIGGVETVLGRELHRLSVNFNAARTMEHLGTPLNALNDYLKDIQ